MSKVFVCYRKSDAGLKASLLQRDLMAEFGAKNVFLDRHSIRGGDDFDARIRRFIRTCDAVVVMIGPTWLDATDGAGRQRIRLVEDVLRSEIEVALTSDVRVVPVLLEGARMPARDELPDSLQALSRLNALDLPDDWWEDGVRKIISAIPASVGPIGEDPRVQRVRELCEDGATVLESEPGRERLETIVGWLNEPLEVAVVGAPGAGKSTLVNALIGRRVAATGDGDATGVLAEYRQGEIASAKAILRHSAPQTLALSDRDPLEGTGISPDEVKRLRIALPSERLAGLVVFDTPGVREAEPAQGDRPTVVRDADALVYVVAADAGIDEAQALRRARADLRDARAGDVSTVIVVTKIDLLDPPRSAAEARAAPVCRREESLHPDAIAVVPVNALVAETIQAAGLDDQDLVDLAALADGPARETALHDPGAGEPSVSPGRHRELAAALGSVGLRRCLELIDAGRRDRDELVAALREECGVTGLVEIVDASFRRRAAALKASRALTEVERVVAALQDEPASARLASGCRALRDELGLDALPLLDTANRIGVSGELMDDLLRLAARGNAAERLGLRGDALPQDVERAAIGAIRRWRGFGDPAMASGSEQRLAARVVNLYTELLERLDEPAAVGSRGE